MSLRNKSFFLILGAMLLFSRGIMAEEAASPELIAKGKTLFNDKAGLGLKHACILCHKNDKAIKQSKLGPLEKLPDVINKYITVKSKGKAIPADSEEMKALIAYIRFEHAK